MVAVDPQIAAAAGRRVAREFHLPDFDVRHEAEQSPRLIVEAREPAHAARVVQGDYVAGGAL